MEFVFSQKDKSPSETDKMTVNRPIICKELIDFALRPVCYLCKKTIFKNRYLSACGHAQAEMGNFSPRQKAFNMC